LKDLSSKHSKTVNRANAEDAEVRLSTIDYCNFISVNDANLQNYSFIADSGASCHMVNDMSLLFDFIEEEGTVKVGVNRKIASKGYGTYKGIHINKDGKKIKITFTRVLLVPGLWINLFSITQTTSKPTTKVICEDNLITVKLDHNEIHFNKCSSHGKGTVLAADFNPEINQEEYDTVIANIITGKMEYTDLHNILGHANNKVINNKAKCLKV
jgi:hypothetical protein